MIVEFPEFGIFGPVQLHFFPSYPKSAPLITWKMLKQVDLPPQPLEWNNTTENSGARLVQALHNTFGKPNTQIQDELFTRCTEFTGSNNINKKVLVFGLGSVGASIAEQLVRCSCNSFILVDIDVVDYPNIARNTYSMRDIGMLKTKALARRLLTINPACDITTVTLNIMEHPQEFVKLAGLADLVVSCADDPLAMDRMSTISYSLKKPAIFPGLYNKCKGAEVVLSMPLDKSPCYRCITNRVPQRRDNIDEVYGFNPKLAAVSALGQDILQLTSIAAKLALAQVQSQSIASNSNPLQQFYNWIKLNRYFLLVITLSSEFWMDWLAQLAITSVHQTQYAMSYNWHSFPDEMQMPARAQCDVCGPAPKGLDDRQWKHLSITDLAKAVDTALNFTDE